MAFEYLNQETSERVVAWINKVRALTDQDRWYVPPTQPQVTTLLLFIESVLDFKENRKEVLAVIMGRAIASQKDIYKFEHSQLIDIVKGNEDEAQFVLRAIEEELGQRKIEGTDMVIPWDIHPRPRKVPPVSNMQRADPARRGSPRVPDNQGFCAW